MATATYMIDTYAETLRTLQPYAGPGRSLASALEVRAKVKGIDETQFQQIAEGAKDMCPISRALKGNVELSVNATLER